MLVVTAPAKVNLHLAVGVTRPDGYHEMTTVVHALELADEVTITPAAALSLRCEPDLDLPAEANLAYRAATAMGAMFDREPAVAIALRKAIPHGAGLGGGSSDAAAVIAGLAHLWGVAIEDPRLVEVAASLGADVPLFLLPSGCALMTGRGDRVDRILPALAATPVVLVRPAEPVPTPAAYAAFDAAPVTPTEPAPVIRALEAADTLALSAALANNLEAAAGMVVPAVTGALSWLRARPGVLGATVAGSGSAVFGLCDSDDAAREAADRARTEGYWGVATRLRGSGVTVAVHP